QPRRQPPLPPPRLPFGVRLILGLLLVHFGQPPRFLGLLHVLLGLLRVLLGQPPQLLFDPRLLLGYPPRSLLCLDPRLRRRPVPFRLTQPLLHGSQVSCQPFLHRRGVGGPVFRLGRQTGAGQRDQVGVRPVPLQSRIRARQVGFDRLE